jgi:hypothetical protein
VRRWLAALTLGLAGCGGIEVRSDVPAGEPETFEIDSWAWGMFGNEIDVGPEPIAKLELDDTLKDKILTYITGGFYSPTHVKVWFVDAPYEPLERAERLTK